MITTQSYPIKTGMNTLILPKGTKLILIGMRPRDLQLCVWVEVDLDRLNEFPVEIVVGVVADGAEVPKGLKHLNSFGVGMEVWHGYWEIIA